MKAWVSRGVFVLLGTTILLIGLFCLQVQLTTINEHDAFIVKANADIKAIHNSVTLYQQDHGQLPESLNDVIPRYLNEYPYDPWGNKFLYEIEHDRAVIYSRGENAKQQLFNNQQ